MTINKILYYAFICTIIIYTSGCADDEQIPVEIQIADLSTTINENPVNGFVLGTITASANRGELSYKLDNQTPAGAMAIDPVTGEVSVEDATLFNFEVNPVITATASVSAEGVSETASVTINLTNIAETVTANAFTATIDENPTDGQLLGTVSATSDAGATLTYSLTTSGNATAFAIDATTGELTVADASQFDFETNPTLTATYTADNGKVSEQGTITITLNDVDDNPLVTGANVFTLAGSIKGNLDANGINARFSSPRGITTDVSGNVYVADRENQSIRKITSEGVVTTVLSGFDPSDLVFDSQGNYFFIDTQIPAVVKIDQATGNGRVFVSDTNSSGSPIFSSPTGIAIDSDENLYVTDGGFHLIYRITPGGSLTRFSGNGQGYTTDINAAQARYNNPTGITVDKNDNIYIADFNNHVIRKISISTSMVTTIAGTVGGPGNVDGIGLTARFDGPRDVAVDSDGKVYVADSRNNSIRSISPTGEVITFAGSAIGQAGSSDGANTDARFSNPTGVRFDESTGNIYVSDLDNFRIRKIVIVD